MWSAVQRSVVRALCVCPFSLFDSCAQNSLHKLASARWPLAHGTRLPRFCSVSILYYDWLTESPPLPV
uniref:Putative secreted protein n=1 Tax=Anopheles marajoara TaxID=58244 RepID=A0A2M4CFG4_9DIPT